MKVAASAAACPKCGGGCSCATPSGSGQRVEMRSAHNQHIQEARSQEKAQDNAIEKKAAYKVEISARAYEIASDYYSNVKPDHPERPPAA